MSGKTKTAAPATQWFGKRPGLFVNNNRFYILMLALMLSVLVFTYFRVHIASDTLYVIRVQQVCGFLALFFWYLAFMGSPLQAVFGKEGVMKQYLYARRALGVSAAYFATLHMLTGLFGQLGGPAKLLLLPGRFKLAILFGFIALIILLVMASISFDRAIRILTFPRWKWLQRLGYIAAVMVFFHIWIIGTHLGYGWVKILLFTMLAVLTTLESWRMSKLVEKKLGGNKVVFKYGLFLVLAAGFITLLVLVPQKTPNYHTQHSLGEMVH